MLSMIVFMGLYLLAAVAMIGVSVADDWIETSTSSVFDFTGNPILLPPDKHEWLLGDPTIISLGGQIHMFANEVFHGIIHLIANSSNPTAFVKVDGIVNLPGAVRAYAYYCEEEDRLFLFYEQYSFPFYNSSSILLRIADIASKENGEWQFSWQAKPIAILQPELDWEKIGTERVGNPFVFFNSLRSEYWLYYSASSVHLNDSNVDEPISIGLARSDSLRGPWSRVSQSPLMITGNDAGSVNLGIGSMKLVKGLSSEGSAMVALINRITQQRESEVTGSTISYAKSEDNGLSWQTVITALIPPSLSQDSDKIWKQAYCYGLDTIEDPTNSDFILTYYNGRNGWMRGNETIGVSRIAKSLFM